MREALEEVKSRYFGLEEEAVKLPLPQNNIFDSVVKNGDKKNIARRLLIDNTILTDQKILFQCKSYLPGCGKNTKVDPKYRQLL